MQIYVRGEGPADPRVGDETNDEAVDDYAYDGWLPLQLSPRDEDGRQHATVIGDDWLTTPNGADAPPGPRPAPVRITSAECSSELQKRTRPGLRHLTEETPEERCEPWLQLLLEPRTCRTQPRSARNDARMRRLTRRHTEHRSPPRRHVRKRTR
ncbi:MAG: hypothetical protein OXG44_09370 [Gammaproteobacteria bacterium]|nr:hypothetical protein [Gammaproteobacteria bacterium]